MTGIILNLAQVPVTLLLLFFDGDSINISGRGIVEGLTLLASFLEMRIFLKIQTQSLA